MILQSIETPADVKGLNYEELDELCSEIRGFIVDAVTTTGGHLGSNLGAVELTIALHRVFDSPRDVLLFDTGHQAYVHKLLTGRRRLRAAEEGGRALGLPEPGRVGARLDRELARLDGAVATPTASPRASPARGRGTTAGWWRSSATAPSPGGMAYEALNNLGHSGAPGGGRPQRQRPVATPDGVAAVRVLTSLRLNPT